MRCYRPIPIGLVLVTTLSIVHSMPPDMTTTTTTRSTPTFGETIKKLTNQLMDVNATTLDMVSDTRTPPIVKQQQQDKMKLKEELENSHAGVAIPVDEDAIEIEDSTKKINFYKIERPTTTNSGLSTWILLSGQGSSTTKSPITRKPIIKPNLEGSSKQNLTIITTDKPTRIVKPIFRKRTPSTPKPMTTTTPTTTITTTTSRVTSEASKLTKIKASVLSNAVYKKNATTTTKPTSTTESSISSTTRGIKVQEKNTVSIKNSTSLPAEAKEGEVDLNNNIDGKKKKTSTKRRKNKPKRRKPSTDKSENTTTISKPVKSNKQNAISTQLYNYLAREIMPTVGVGLVGLMVTAGLASYFLYPFGAARRTYEVDRKDKEGSYYYSDDYSGGIPEEEAIGKVIAGMPSNSLFSNSYKAPTSRDTAYPNTKYRLTDRRAQIKPQYYGDVVQGSIENIPVQQNKHKFQSDSFEPITYPSDQMTRFSPSFDQKFVVGSIPKEVAEEATPAAVPEHGPRNFIVEENLAEEPTFILRNAPLNSSETRFNQQREYGPRSLKIRKKRSGISNEINEIDPSFDEETTTLSQTTETERYITTILPSTENSTTTVGPTSTIISFPDKVSSFIDLVKELVHFKAKLGLQVIQNITQSISKYITRAQARLDEHYRKYSKSNN